MIPYIPFKKYARVEKRIRKMVRGKDATDRRDALAYGLGLHGLRVTEVVNLTCGDLNRVDEFLYVATLKRGKPRRVTLGPGFYAELRRLAAKRPDAAPLFATSTGKPVHPSHWQDRFRDLTAELLGGEGLNFHGCRHTYAMRLYVKTKDMQRVKARLGHRSGDSTQVYVEAYGELDDDMLAGLGEFSVLPSLKVRARGGRKGRGTAIRGVGCDDGSSEPAPSSRPQRPVSISTQRKNASVLGENADFREMERTFSRPGADRSEFPRSDEAGPTLLRLHKVRPLKDLRREASA